VATRRHEAEIVRVDARLVIAKTSEMPDARIVPVVTRIETGTPRAIRREGRRRGGSRGGLGGNRSRREKNGAQK